MFKIFISVLRFFSEPTELFRQKYVWPGKQSLRFRFSGPGQG